MAMPAAPDAPRTFVGDPNPPPEAPEQRPVSRSTAAPTTSAGSGALPPEKSTGMGAPTDQPAPPTAERFYSVVQRPDGSRDAFMSDANGDEKLFTVSNPDAEHILHSVGHYDEDTKTWDNVPEDIVKSLGTGRLGFPERIVNAWKGGEVGVLRSLLGAKVMNGEMTAADAREQADPLLVKLRLDEDPSVAWQGGLGKTVAQYLKHPVAAAEKAAVGAVGMVPLMKDILLHGTAPGAAMGATAGGAAAAVGSLATGPLAPAVAVDAVVMGMKVGAEYGTFRRSMDLMGGQFAMDMADHGYDDETIKRYAPIVGAVDGALTLMQFDLMTPSIKSAALEKVLGSDAVKASIATWLKGYAGHTAQFGALGTAQEAVSIYVNNIAAAAGLTPEPTDGLLTHGNIDITNRPRVQNADGSVSTVRSIGVNVDGKEVLLPTVSPDGKNLTEEQAIELYQKTGKHLGIFSSPEASNKYAEWLHQDQAARLREISGPDAKKRLLEVALDSTLAGAVIGGVTEGARAVGGKMTASEAEGIKPKILRTAEETAKANEELAKTSEKGKGAAAEPEGNKYVVDRPFDIAIKENDKRTATDIREEFSGLKNEQIVRGNQLSDTIKKAVPEETERQGMFWYKAADGDHAILEDALKDPDLEAYHEQIQAALDLSPKAVETLKEIDRYYQEAGDVSKAVGTIGNIVENYQNRLYVPEKQGDYVKTELGAGIKRTTRHSMERVFDTEFDAARAGKVFATTDVADTLSLHNEEMARVNSARKMADALVDVGLGAWKREVPEGWAPVGTLEKNVPIKDARGEAVIGEDGNQFVSRSQLVAPAGIAKGLSAIADPNFTRHIDSLRGLQRYQGLVKTVDLSFSLFHHFSMLMQTVYERDFSALVNLPKMTEMLEKPEFKEMEQDFVRHGGITAKVEANRDILRKLTEDNHDFFSKVVNAPGVKQILDAADRNSEFLFGKMQRFQKVYSYMTRVSEWVADHPNATNAEVLEVKRGFAKHTNAVFGGLNWEAMGMSKSNLSLLRLGMLAPDWTISNLSLLKQAIGEKGPAGNASRSHILAAMTIGMLITEGVNKMLTGHYTDQNKPGHKLEVEVAPDVYVSMLRGGIGDISKFASMIAESGLGGASRFAQGKLAPLPRTAIGVLTNREYTGKPIVRKHAGPIYGTYDVLKYALQNGGPIPLGLSNLLSYASSGKANAAGGATVVTGVGRYSKGTK